MPVCKILSSLMFFPVFLSIILMQGCAGEERFADTTTLKDFQASVEKEQPLEVSGVSIQNTRMETIPEVVEGDYLLGPGDLLSITVFETEDLNTEVRVSSRGYVNVPLLDEVQVLNLTAAEAEQKIEDLYKKDFLHDPHVSVYIKEHMSKQITLVGAVESPGTFDYVSSRKLLDVLAIADGLQDDAGPIAYVTRKDHKTGRTATYQVDLDDLVKNGNMAHNHTIVGGDVIYIPESGYCFVDGAVRKPGSYAISSNMTVTGAITLAGGLASWADDDKIKLIRYMGRGQDRQVVSLSYSDLQAGVGDTLVLLDQDIIYAESSASGKFFSGTGFTLGFMGTGVTFRNPEN